MTKVDIISGFLGAGKTTLIKKLIQEVFQGQKLVLIENEFGEIGVDGGFLKDAGVEITEMNSGCICCSLVGDFGKALAEVIATYAPERIIIEPSGVGKLSDVIKAVQKVQEENELEISGCVTVVDAQKCKMYAKNFGEFFNNQIENAQTLILSRSQNLTEDKLTACVELLKGINADAKILTTPWTELPGAVIMEAIERKNSLLDKMIEEETCPVCGHVHHHDHEHEHHHDHDGECCCHDHDHEHHHHHDHDEECCCHDHEHEHHHHHDHDEECCCHDHEHEHHHHHDHDEECCCHDHDHEHHHHHDHDGECCCHDHEHEHHHHHADEVFETWGKETPKHYTEAMLKEILEKLDDNDKYGIVLRAKGIVMSENNTWVQFDYVPGEFEIREGAADYTGRFCVIGSKLQQDALEELFQ